ncbi:MAG: ParA family protein [Nitrospirae bacterium]|nr:ParA family protein [Nitrospirota bacterium]
MGKIIAIANQKGGVGKTTTAINIAASLAVAEKRVLLIDLDPQGNTTSGVGIDRTSLKETIYDVLIQKCPLERVIIDSELESLKVVPSNIDLIGAELELVEVQEREEVLKGALTPVSGRFDYIFIDCPPSLGLLTLNALTAAGSVLIPVQCEYYAMEGLSQLWDTITRVRRSFNSDLAIEGILLTMYDGRNNLCNQVAGEIQKHFKDLVFESLIPRNITLGEAPSHGKPVLLYNISSRGAQSYLELAKEVLRNEKKGLGARA